MQTKIAGVVGGALVALAVTAGTAYAGHHQTHGTPTGSQTVVAAVSGQAGGPYKPVHQTAGSTTYGKGVSVAEALDAELAKQERSATAARAVCYRAHVADYGWLGTTCNGGTAGSVGLNKAIEALEVAVGGAGRFCVNAHLRDVPCQGTQCADDGDQLTVGTVGQARPMEAFAIGVSSGAVNAQAHVQNIGWMDPQSGGAVVVGTTGRAYNLEAIKIWL
ncbi:hypothetical protein [Streptomyces capitiformicae]|uniref:Uncharacterized protein n=1 Tax=Streptomyces capitiformicae TaxID=2014920 RepID=A0A918ZP30_9ACTN|nr:hypothetical protein [Streptomyces capitiformicae]GHE63523.1 hypothetical protein GCM10017771_86880 [Streptomyces capitiformicae]